MKIIALNGRLECLLDNQRIFYAPLSNAGSNLCFFLNTIGSRGDVRNLELKELLTPEEWNARVVPEINKQFKHGYTRLHSAAQTGNLDIAKKLLADGAKSDVKDHEGQTPLDLAVSLRHKAIVELLRESSPNRVYGEIAFGTPEKLAELLKDKANSPNKNSTFNALHVAVMYNRLDMAPALLAGGVDINQKVWREHGEGTALTLAVEAHSADWTRFLVEHNANPTLSNGGGADPLKIARARKYDDLVKILEPAVDAFKKKQSQPKPQKPPTAPKEQF